MDYYHHHTRGVNGIIGQNRKSDEKRNVLIDRQLQKRSLCSPAQVAFGGGFGSRSLLSRISQEFAGEYYPRLGAACLGSVQVKETHVALALVEREGRWLVSRRAPGRIFAGLWEFPGGKVENGESAMEAAVRETREEVGVAVRAIKEWTTIDSYPSPEMRVILHLILCEYVGGEAHPCDAAIEAVEWADLSDIRHLPMPPANSQVIAAIERHTPSGGR